MSEEKLNPKEVVDRVNASYNDNVSLKDTLLAGKPINRGNPPCDDPASADYIDFCGHRKIADGTLYSERGRTGKSKVVSLSDLIIGPWQEEIERVVTPEATGSLAWRIYNAGKLDDLILVVEDPDNAGKYFIISGHHRCESLKLLGQVKTVVVVLDLTMLDAGVFSRELLRDSKVMTQRQLSLSQFVDIENGMSLSVLTTAYELPPASAFDVFYTGVRERKYWYKVLDPKTKISKAHFGKMSKVANDEIPHFVSWITENEIRKDDLGELIGEYGLLANDVISGWRELQSSDENVLDDDQQENLHGSQNNTEIVKNVIEYQPAFNYIDKDGRQCAVIFTTGEPGGTITKKFMSDNALTKEAKEMGIRKPGTKGRPPLIERPRNHE